MSASPGSLLHTSTAASTARRTQTRETDGGAHSRSLARLPPHLTSSPHASPPLPNPNPLPAGALPSPLAAPHGSRRAREGGDTAPAGARAVAARALSRSRGGGGRARPPPAGIGALQIQR